MRKSKLNTQRNQDPPGIVLLAPGVHRRVAVIVARSDRDNLIPGTNITMDELHRHVVLGRRLQARAMASALAGLLRAVVWPLKKLAAIYAPSRRQVAAIRQLGALDDHLLQDIGIRRENIPQVVAGLMSRPAVTDAAAAPVALRPSGQPAACNDRHARAAA